MDVSAPRGSFTLRPGDAPVVLLSAGIGVTPCSRCFMSWRPKCRCRKCGGYMEPAITASTHLPRRRAPSSKLCHAAAATFATVRPIQRIVKVLISTPADAWDMHVLEELGVPREADFYICGPPAFISDLTAGLDRLGWYLQTASTPRFSVQVLHVTPGIATSPRRLPHLPEGAPGTGPLVSFARTGLNVRWGPAFQSLLELAEACDLPVRWSCRTGVCHTCETGLVARDGWLPARPGRCTGGRQRADLLLAPRGLRRH